VLKERAGDIRRPRTHGTKTERRESCMERDPETDRGFSLIIQHVLKYQYVQNVKSRSTKKVTQ
jgi:hypothetical protein